MAAGSSSKPVVYAALAGNLLVAVTKFIAATWTGSSAMLSEGIHSVVDCSNQGLLLYGYRRAARPPDEQHPLGHGREIYFWSFIVALLMFSLGAGFSTYEGIMHVLEPPELGDPLISYIVLGCSAVFEGSSLAFAVREFRRSKGDLGYFEAVERSKNPPAFLVLFEDSAALIGLAIAFAGTYAAERLDMPVLDSIASIGIGLLLAVTATIIARESKGLLLGEPATNEVNRSILAIAEAEPGIERPNGLYTVHLAPDQIVATLSVEFDDSLRTPEIEARVEHLERTIKQKHPEVIAVFVKPQAASKYGSQREQHFEQLG